MQAAQMEGRAEPYIGKIRKATAEESSPPFRTASGSGRPLEHLAHDLEELQPAVGFGEKGHAPVRLVPPFQELLGVARREDGLEAGPASPRFTQQLLSADAVRHDQVREQQVDPARPLQDLE